MHVLLVGPASSAHLQQWAGALRAAGVRVDIATVHPDGPADSSVHAIRPAAPLGYVVGALGLAKLVRRLQPDVVHAHYATGYGLMSRWTSRVPLVVSAWGSDVMHFPTKSRLHRWFVRSNLSTAAIVCVTSRAMVPAVHGLGVDPRRVRLTPFGVDTTRFVGVEPPSRSTGPIVVGTVKALDPIYGVDVLIDAVSSVRDELATDVADRLQLVVIGDGPARGELERLVDVRRLRDVVTFRGAIPHADVPAALRTFDVFAALSRRESFGVAVLEASACGLPVVVSDAGGLPEVVCEGVTGLVVPAGDSTAASAAIRELILDEPRRRQLGAAGRALVESTFSWPACATAMLRVYEEARGNPP